MQYSWRVRNSRNSDSAGNWGAVYRKTFFFTYCKLMFGVLVTMLLLLYKWLLFISKRKNSFYFLWFKSALAINTEENASVATKSWLIRYSLRLKIYSSVLFYSLFFFINKKNQKIFFCSLLYFMTQLWKKATCFLC